MALTGRPSWRGPCESTREPSAAGCRGRGRSARWRRGRLRGWCGDQSRNVVVRRFLHGVSVFALLCCRGANKRGILEVRHNVAICLFQSRSKVAMSESIKSYIEMIIRAARVFGQTDTAQAQAAPVVKDVMTSVKEVVKELNVLSLRDFEPSAQADFLRARGNLVWLTGKPSYEMPRVIELLESASRALDHYLGLGNGGETRRFAFVQDSQLRSIVERDYAELIVKLYPSGAWKSCVILAGSILEAILVDRLSQSTRLGLATASPRVPVNRRGVRIPMDDWKLVDLINISVDIGAIQDDPAETIHRVLRDYRNFVHPKKEIRAAHECAKAEAMVSIGALDSICNYLDKNP